MNKNSKLIINLLIIKNYNKVAYKSMSEKIILNFKLILLGDASNFHLNKRHRKDSNIKPIHLSHIYEYKSNNRH